MKKLVAIGLSMVMVLGMSSMAFANGKGNNQEPKVKQVEVSVTGPTEEIEVGDIVELSASAEKHGQIKNAYWIGAADGGTILNVNTDMYESTATFTATEVGTFEVTYNIRMEAGKSHVAFVGSGSATVEVVNGETVIVQRVTIRVVKKELEDKQNNPATEFTLEVEIELSNGDIIVETIEQSINHNQTQRNVSFEFEIEEDIVVEDNFFLQKSANVGDIVYEDIAE